MPNPDKADGAPVSGGGAADLTVLTSGSLPLARLVLKDQITQQDVVFVVNNGQLSNP